VPFHVKVPEVKKVLEKYFTERIEEIKNKHK